MADDPDIVNTDKKHSFADYPDIDNTGKKHWQWWLMALIVLRRYYNVGTMYY